MEIKISTRHGSLGEPAQEKIRSKVQKLHRIFERLISIDVTVDLEKADHPNVEVMVAAEHKKDFVASFSSNELFGALDQCIHKLEQQLRKYKEKIQSHNRTKGEFSEEDEEQPEKQS